MGHLPARFSCLRPWPKRPGSLAGTKPDVAYGLPFVTEAQGDLDEWAVMALSFGCQQPAGVEQRRQRAGTQRDTADSGGRRPSGLTCFGN
jgi:hypothetical protein